MRFRFKNKINWDILSTLKAKQQTSKVIPNGARAQGRSSVVKSACLAYMNPWATSLVSPRPGTVVHAYNPSGIAVEAGGWSSRSSLGDVESS